MAAKRCYAARMLSSRQRSHLKALAHDKKPVILMGHKGLTDAVVKETDAALLAHELIKVKLADDTQLDAHANEIAARTESDLVTRVGKVAILYRAHPDEPRIRLPREARSAQYEDPSDDPANDGFTED
jgi:RNA-binding protein